MPKILIREYDQTGDPIASSYSNYAVLITGFMNRTPITPEMVEESKIENPNDSTEWLTADRIQPDPNGVYEFSDAQDFEDTIGLLGPKVLVGADEIAEYHYGNQMAYELLKLGYPIIYKPIKSVKEMNDGKFWDVFKDKTSYSFRFINHGLLNSSPEYDIATYNALSVRISQLDEAIKKLEAIAAEAEASTDPDTTLKTLYEDVKDDYEGFKYTYTDAQGKEITTQYEDFEAADAGTDTEREDKNGKLEALKRFITISDINAINGHIAKLAYYNEEQEEASGRGDCIALIELDERTYINSNSSEQATKQIIEAIKNMNDINNDNGSYCALTVPSVVYKMSAKEAEFSYNKKLPGAFHYLACFINSIKSGFAEWYAAAGYTRGVSSFVIDQTTVKLGEVAVNALEPRNITNQSEQPKFACNVITNFRGNYYLWGNRTAQKLDESDGNKDLKASHFLNIRQLCTTIKKQLYVASRRFTFDPNSDTLWFNFVNAIRPTLEAMKADQGIRDYKILKETANNKKATIYAVIRIIPIEAVEDFELTVRLEDTFGETTIGIGESN